MYAALSCAAEAQYRVGIGEVMDGVTIRVMYSCAFCGLDKATVDVPARGVEEVCAWMDNTLTPALVENHKARSPDCQPPSLSAVWIPITGASKIGGAAEN